MVRPDGLVKVLDFGLAKLTERPKAPPEVDSQAKTIAWLSTAPGVVMGTASYMSPEQARGQKVDHRTDIFSLGVMLYEMIVGRRPFEGASTSDVMAAILREHPAPLSRQAEEIPNQLEQIVNKMLAKRPEERYQSVREVENDLRECRAALSLPTTPPNQLKALRQLIRRPLIAFPVVLALVAALVLIPWFIYHNAKARWAREQAIPEITRLIQEDKYTAAAVLAREAEKYIPADPALSQLWPEMTRDYSISTTPPGADVYVKEYAAVDREWEYLGRSPIERVRIPLGDVRWKIEKTGFNAVEGASVVSDSILKPSEIGKISFTLDKKESSPSGMVRVTGGMIMP